MSIIFQSLSFKVSFYAFKNKRSKEVDENFAAEHTSKYL